MIPPRDEMADLRRQEEAAPRIGFWHHIADGFRGRCPIDAEFLKHHRGE